MRVLRSSLLLTRGLALSSTSGKIPHSQKTQPVIVQEKLEAWSKFATTVTVGDKHITTSDLKECEKGANAGPSPKELLMSALGSCTVMTIRTFFENSKALPNSAWNESSLDRVTVLLIEEMGDHAHVPRGLRLDITLDGRLTEAQRQRLIRAASNCPVKKMMSGGLEIATSLTD